MTIASLIEKLKEFPEHLTVEVNFIDWDKCPNGSKFKQGTPTDFYVDDGRLLIC